MSKYNEIIGKGVVGLGQNELKKRVKQHKTLANEAKNKVGLLILKVENLLVT